MIIERIDPDTGQLAKFYAKPLNAIFMGWSDGVAELQTTFGFWRLPDRVKRVTELDLELSGDADVRETSPAQSAYALLKSYDPVEPLAREKGRMFQRTEAADGQVRDAKARLKRRSEGDNEADLEVLEASVRDAQEVRAELDNEDEKISLAYEEARALRGAIASAKDEI